jgi:hypothetical protein
MKRAATILAAAAVTTLAIWSAPHVVTALRERWTAPQPAVAYLGSASKLGAEYQRWTAMHEAAGGDRKVTLALRWSRGLSVERSRAAGQARLDLVEGAVTVEVRGLPEAEWDVWLVDNQDGEGRSVAPEPGDRVLRAGRLQTDGDVARLDTRLERGALATFELDLVVVARAGVAPWDRGVLFGSPSLFQRLYTRARTGPPAADTTHRTMRNALVRQAMADQVAARRDMIQE